MKTILNKLALTTLAGALIVPAVEAQEQVTFVGGNATIAIVQSRAASILSGATLDVNSTNSNIFSYVGGTIGGNPVQLNFNLTGGAAAIADLTNNPPTPVVIWDNSTTNPTAAISITGPGTIGIPSERLFTELFTLASPVVFVKNTNLPNSIDSITNLTSRQAAILEAFSGTNNPTTGYTLTTSALGGSSTTDPIYFVGRNEASAVRQVTDANIYFNYLLGQFGYPVVNWTTNSPGQPPISWAGASSGSQEVQILNTLSNAIGTVAIGNLTSTLTPLNYEGVPFSVTNVQNGSYALYGVERYLFLNSGTYAPNSVQYNAITNLVGAITDPSFANNVLVTNLYVPLTALNDGAVGAGGVNNGTVKRDPDNDGFPIFPNPINNYIFSIPTNSYAPATY